MTASDIGLVLGGILMMQGVIEAAKHDLEHCWLAVCAALGVDAWIVFMVLVS